MGKAGKQEINPPSPEPQLLTSKASKKNRVSSAGMRKTNSDIQAIRRIFKVMH